MKHLLLAAFAATSLIAADPPEPRFEPVTIDDRIQIGYGVAVADVDGDKLPDILLADKKQFVWYRNPGKEKAADRAAWAKHLIAENLTKNDNVCLAAQDIDGDGKCELAVGAEWNPGDTINSGAVFYMIAPADRTQPWTPVKLHAEPTTHRMRWLQLSGDSRGDRGARGEGGKPDGLTPSAPSATPRETSTWGLVVGPLHGRGNKNGEGAGVKVLLYHPPAPLNDPKGEWKTELIDESMHMTHNFESRTETSRSGGSPTSSARDYTRPSVLLAGKEGIVSAYKTPDGWERWPRTREGAGAIESSGAGEVRTGWLPGKERALVAAVAPMHGNRLMVYSRAWDNNVNAGWAHKELTDKLTEGHALGCGDLLGAGSDQIVVGWRGSPGKEGSTHGIHLWAPLDPQGEKWRESVVDDGGMACEDLQLADLDGDGKLDIVASGRATRNVKLYLNRTAR